jgi:DNA (cytosine-5)-methyltransferase 1
MTPPTSQQIVATRNNARITQTAAAAMVHVKLRTWQKWEANDSKMHPGLWELFNIKLKGKK